MSYDRFDLEDAITSCWTVVEDIRLLVDRNSDIEDFRALNTLYNHKFDKLWEVYQSLVKQGAFFSPEDSSECKTLVTLMNDPDGQ